MEALLEPVGEVLGMTDTSEADLFHDEDDVDMPAGLDCWLNGCCCEYGCVDFFMRWESDEVPWDCGRAGE